MGTFEQELAQRQAAERERDMVRQALCDAVAHHMGATLNGRQNGHHYYLTPERETFALHCWDERGAERITISGQWPTARTADGCTQVVTPRNCGAIPYGETPPEATASTKRSIAALSADFSRRFLPAFVPIWRKCKEAAEERTDQSAAAKKAAERIAARFGHERREVNVRELEATFYVREHGNVRVTHYYGKPEFAFESRLTGLTEAQIVAILETLGAGRA